MQSVQKESNNADLKYDLSCKILRAYAISTVQISTKCELLRLGWAESACRPRWDSSLQQQIQTSPFMEL